MQAGSICTKNNMSPFPSMEMEGGGIDSLTLIQCITVKPVLGGHSKIDQTKVLKTVYHLMQVKSIAECSPLEHSAILLTCIKQ